MTKGHVDFLEPLGKQSYLNDGGAKWIAVGLSYKGQRQTLRGKVLKRKTNTRRQSRELCFGNIL